MRGGTSNKRDVRPAAGRGVRAAVVAAVTGWAAAAAAAPSSVGPDGYVRSGGEPRFPLGIYHVSWSGERRMDARQIEDLAAVCAAGFDLMAPSVDADPDGHAFMSAAAARNVGVIVEPYWPLLGTTVPALRGSPSLLGWNVGDDFNWPPAAPKYSPAAFAERGRLAKRLDPDHLTFGAGLAYPGFEVRAYGGGADVLGVQCYPYGDRTWDADGPLLTCLDAWGRAARELEGTGSVPFAIPQLTYIDEPSRRYPTAAEYRATVFGAVASGMRGVIGYSYFDPRGFLPANAPALWASIPGLNREIGSIVPFLLSAARADRSAGPLRASAWTAAGETLTVAVNGSARAGAAVTVGGVGRTCDGAVEPLYGSVPAARAGSAGHVAVLPPGGVGIYICRPGSPTPPLPAPAPTATATPTAAPATSPTIEPAPTAAAPVPTSTPRPPFVPAAGTATAAPTPARGAAPPGACRNPRIGFGLTGTRVSLTVRAADCPGRVSIEIDGVTCRRPKWSLDDAARLDRTGALPASGGRFVAVLRTRAGEAARKVLLRPAASGRRGLRRRAARAEGDPCGVVARWRDEG